MIFKTIILSAVIFMTACSSKMERDYIKGCSADGAAKEICECAYEKLEDKFSEEVIENIDKTGIIPNGFMEENIYAIRSCAAEN